MNDATGTTALEWLERLAGHLAWADRRVLQGLRANPGNDAAALEYFAHVLAAEHLWLSRIKGTPRDLEVWPALTLDECSAVAERNQRELESFIGGLEPHDLAREVPYVNSAGDAFVSRTDDILLHVMLHGTYHRGQVSLMVRRSGGTPMPTDYIAFIRGAPTATRSP
jgi:uncharacterized damage-inducible protein DinB